MSQAAERITVAPRHVVVVHYHEIGLKGRNRGLFERALVSNLRRALAPTGATTVEVLRGRLVVPVRSAVSDEVVEAVRATFGVAVCAPALEVGAGLEQISAAALSLTAGRDARTFAVSARRSSKEGAMTSRDVNVAVGDAVRLGHGLRVDLDDPDVTVYVEVVGARAFVYTERVRGPGGLPVGVSGRVVSLLSGGIDSPVAVYRMCKRGARSTLVHFHSAPFTDMSSSRKAVALAERIASWQGPTRLFLVGFGKTQQRIVAASPPALRVVLYRRFMMRVAVAIAEGERAAALVTGDSLGQVASQTLPNLACTEDASSLPVLRPLIGDDKQDIIAAAQQIGTYETSILPYEDCCSLFVPRSPATGATVEACRDAESELDVDELVRACLASAELRTVGGGGVEEVPA